MFPFLNMRLKTTQVINSYIEKMNKNELTLEELLDEDDLVQDVKSNPNTHFTPFFSNEVIRKLIDYSTKMPSEDEFKKGHKYPFNATEILCSNNKDILDRFLNEIKISEDDDSESEEDDDDKEEEEKNKENKNNTISMIETIQNKIEEIQKEPKEEKKEEVNKEEEKIEELKKEEEEKKEELKNKEELKKEEEVNKEELKNKEELIKEEEKNKEELKNEEEEKKEEEVNKEESEDSSKEPKFRIIYDNLDYFFQFLNTESSEDNYVLIGYFTKIFNHLIQSKGQIIISYIFNSHPEYLTGLINHLNRRGIGDCIKNILLFNEEIKDLEKLKISFCEKIIKELNNSNKEDKYIWITDTLINTFENKDFFNLFMSNQNLLKQLFQILYNNLNNNNNSKSLLSLLIKINENILSNFDELVTTNLIQENPMDIFSNLYGNVMEEEKITNEEKLENQKNNINFLFNALKECNLNFLDDLNIFNDNDLLETTYQKTQKKLGLKKLCQVEYFRTIIDILINANSKDLFKNDIEEIIKLANEKKVFWTLNDIFFNYEFNNIYQIYYFQIITSILNKFSPESLINYFFSDSSDIITHRKLIGLLIEHLLNNNKFDFGFSRNANSCSFPIEVKILNSILQSENEYIKNIIEGDSDFLIINEVLINDINNLFNQKLLESKDNFDDYGEQNSEVQTMNNKLSEIIEENINIFKVYKEGGDYKKLQNEKNQKSKRKISDVNEMDLNMSDEVDLSNNLEDNNNNNEEPDEKNDNVLFNKDKEIFGDDENMLLDNNNDEEKKEDNLKENDKYYDSNYWCTSSNISEEEMDLILKDL